jgi:hypothetical protein
MIQFGVPSPVFTEDLQDRIWVPTTLSFLIDGMRYMPLVVVVFFSFQLEVQFGICLQVARHITRTSTRWMNWLFNSHMITTMITMGG